MNYLWAVTGGTITGGQGTHSVTIMWDGGASAISSVSITETDATPESRTATQPIATITTGINKGLGSTGISVFPNPIKNQFTIEMPTANTAVYYTVYSTSGVQMQAGSFKCSCIWQYHYNTITCRYVSIGVELRWGVYEHKTSGQWSVNSGQWSGKM